MNKLFIFLILACTTFSSIFAEESVQDPSQSLVADSSIAISKETIQDPIRPTSLKEEIPEASDSISSQKSLRLFPFVSCPTLGIGVSMRTKSLAFDATAQSTLLYKSLSFTASPILYFSGKKTRPYVSAGLGLAVQARVFSSKDGIKLTFPLRVGIEGKRFFADLGGSYSMPMEATYIVNFGSSKRFSKHYFPLPEIRCGFGF